MTDPISNAPPWRLLAAFAVVALAARLVAAIIVGDAPYLDPAYYEVVARRLVAGDGFSVPVLWSFLDVGSQLPADPQLPIPSNRHWMPLASVLSAISMAVFGTSTLAAQLPSIVLGAALVPLTVFIAWDLWRSRTVAVVSGVLALLAGPMLVYLPLVESFALFGVAGATAIYASIRAVRDDRGGPWLLLAGVMVATATLTRIDGILLGAAPLTAWLVRRGIGPWHRPGTRIGFGWALVGVIAAGAVLAPWLVRQWLVFGSPIPSAGGATLWITSYNEQFSIGHPVGIASYLEWGVANIVGSKVGAFVLLVGRTTVLLGGIFVIPFVYGLIRERGRAELAPFLVTFWLVFALMVLAFTFHAPSGAYYHSAWAWLPFAIPLSVASFGPMLHSLGRRIPLFGRARNVRFLLWASVAGAVVLSLVGSAALLSEWRGGRERLETIAGFLADVDQSDVVMYVDPPSLHLETGLPVVAPPFDPPDVIGQVAEAYDVRWLAVERLPGAAQDPLGLWEGAEWTSPSPVFEGENVRIFEVRP